MGVSSETRVAVILLNANLYVWKIVRMWRFCGFRGEIDGADDDARGCKVSQCQGQRVRVKGISSGKPKTTRKVNEMQQFRMAGGENSIMPRESPRSPRRRGMTATSCSANQVVPRLVLWT